MKQIQRLGLLLLLSVLVDCVAHVSTDDDQQTTAEPSLTRIRRIIRGHLAKPGQVEMINKRHFTIDHIQFLLSFLIKSRSTTMEIIFVVEL